MTPFISKIRTILSDKNASIAIIALVIVARIVQLIFFYNIRVDGMYQVIGMQNFVEGHGVSFSQVLPTDLSKVIYEPLINWPPGYSILLSPFYILLGHDYILAGIILDIIAAVVLIIACRKILKELDVPAWLINIFTLLTGFFIYYFYYINSSDAIAVSFFVLAIWMVIKQLKRNDFSVSSALLMTLFLFASGSIKYLFIPVVFIIPFFLMLKGHADKNTGFKKSGILSFSLLAVLLGGLLLWQKLNSGAAVYISEPERAFFPENLLGAHPAIPASFVNPDTINLVFPVTSKAFQLCFRTLQCLHLLLFLAALIYVLRRISKYGFRKMSVTDSFFYMAFFLSLGITLVLTFLSLTVAREMNAPGHLWTYVEEPRYYGLVNVLIHLGIFVLYAYYRLKRARPLKYLIIVLAILMLPETFRGIVFTANRVIKVKEEKYIWQKEQEIQEYADLLIKRKKQKDEMVVVTGSSYYVNHRVGLYSHAPVLLNATALNNPSTFHTQRPVLLLVMIEEGLTGYNAFERDHQNEFVNNFGGFYFYILHVKP